jgi:hypothetical protein
MLIFVATGGVLGIVGGRIEKCLLWVTSLQKAATTNVAYLLASAVNGKSRKKAGALFRACVTRLGGGLDLP